MRGCTAEFGGTYEANISARRTLTTFSAVLLVLVFFILVVATKAPIRAFIVMATLPLALVGAVIAVALTGRIVSVASAVGLITVAGFVIRNGLLLENRYAELEREGHEPAEAIRIGSRERMVPILMTSLTTVFGLIPIVAALDVPPVARANPGGHNPTKYGGRPEDRPPPHEGNFPAYTAKVQGILLLSPFGVTTER